MGEKLLIEYKLVKCAANTIIQVGNFVIQDLQPNNTMDGK